MNPEKVIVEGLNYGRITPEAIESEIRLVRFQPSGITNNFTPGNPVKFLLQGDGYIDPMSAYIRFTVQVNDLENNEARFVDRSAHSFIQRLLLTCNGVEIERVEDYEVLSAMIQDTLYSTEQQIVHGFEGMPTQLYDLTSKDLCIPNSLKIGSYFNQADGDIAVRSQFLSTSGQRNLTMIHSAGGASTNVFTKVGEPAFYDDQTTTAAVYNYNPVPTSQLSQSQVYETLPGTTYNGYSGFHLSAFPKNFTENTAQTADNTTVTCNQWSDPLSYDFIQDGVAQSIVTIVEKPSQITITPSSGPQYTAQVTSSSMNLTGCTTMQFCIPIYSALIGVLMPHKRFVPLRVIPLELELMLSRYALYSSFGPGSSPPGSRNYQITRIELYANMLKFFNDIPKAVDELVAQEGIFFHLNNFYKGPIQNIGSTLPGTAQINLSFNCVNSVHWIFLYQGYAANASQRRLHFVSHCLQQAQVQNGTLYVPNDPIQSLQPLIGNSGSNRDNSHAPFYLEYLKSWNRMHDPAVDCGVFANNYCYDQLGCQGTGYSQGIFQAINQVAPLQFTGTINYINLEQAVNYGPVQVPYAFTDAERLFLQMLQKQGNVGRCQYGISLEGDQLAETKTAITGRKAVLPFQISLYGSKADEALGSEMYIFLRIDSILHIQSDMRVTLTR